MKKKKEISYNKIGADEQDNGLYKSTSLLISNKLLYMHCNIFCCDLNIIIDSLLWKIKSHYVSSNIC